MKLIRSAFTLVEILVVLAILVVLTALLLPVFSLVRERAFVTTCASNLKQIGMSAQLYMQDCDEALPLPAHAVTDFADSSAADWQPNVFYAMLPYIKSKQILFCPSVSPSYSDYAPTVLSNTNYLGNGVVAGRKSVSVPNPSTLIFLQEFPYRTNSFYSNPFWDESEKKYCINDGYSNGNPEEYFNFPRPVHNEGENVLFADGHVKWRNVSSLQKEEFGLKSTGPFYNRQPPTEHFYDAAF